MRHVSLSQAKRAIHIPVTQTGPLTLFSPSPLIHPVKAESSFSARQQESASLAEDFKLWPGFFPVDATRQLLRASLWKLDRADTSRRRRRRAVSAETSNTSQIRSLQSLFEGDYGFEEGHYDSVIHHYRETLLSSLPPHSSAFPDLVDLLSRLYALLPDAPSTEALAKHRTTPAGTSTHLLHLAPRGAIDAHVDNVEASGGTIIGASLGAERVLRLRRKDGAGEGWDILLPNGSVYLQKARVRYDYEHSILGYDEAPSWEGHVLERGHRISLMVRDALAKSDVPKA